MCGWHVLEFEENFKSVSGRWWQAVLEENPWKVSTEFKVWKFDMHFRKVKASFFYYFLLKFCLIPKLRLTNSGVSEK